MKLLEEFFLAVYAYGYYTAIINERHISEDDPQYQTWQKMKAYYIKKNEQLMTTLSTMNVALDSISNMQPIVGYDEDGKACSSAYTGSQAETMRTIAKRTLEFVKGLEE